ncbi:predicted protein [Chaetoceros tenuissimus]|uniref:Uncharacterized protein n=1 Tax=Chaetoceros tenuissimus TaxID=426638 RepID=A0AAD3CF32_9STRA|nr:predicted protein [Chaetoceros tenuissimus]
MSERSLLEGAILEYKSTSDIFRIVEKLLKYGGQQLVMVEKRWRNCNKGKINIFHFLSEQKESLDRYDFDIDEIVDMMNMVIDLGGYDLVMKRNENGQSILQTFAYFEYEE